MTRGGFTAEADMLSPIAAASRGLAGSGMRAFFEVSSMAGIPDVVFARFHQTQLADRVESGGPLTEVAPLRVVLAMATRASNRAIGAEEIASLAALSHRYTAGKILPALRDAGWVEMADRGRWSLVRPFRSVADRLVVVEAKLKAWRKGLGQATRLAAGADAAWLVVAAPHVSRACASGDWFAQSGVGLAALQPAGRLDVLIRPRSTGVLSLRREMLAERVAAMYLAGVHSGPVAPVFGRRLLATTGPDPRLAGASAR